MIIRNGKIITGSSPNEILDSYAIEIERRFDQIRFSGFRIIDPALKIDEIIDAQGQYVLPGLICAHTHFYGALRKRDGYPR